MNVKALSVLFIICFVLAPATWASPSCDSKAAQFSGAIVFSDEGNHRLWAAVTPEQEHFLTALGYKRQGTLASSNSSGESVQIENLKSCPRSQKKEEELAFETKDHGFTYFSSNACESDFAKKLDLQPAHVSTDNFGSMEAGIVIEGGELALCGAAP